MQATQLTQQQSSKRSNNGLLLPTTSAGTHLSSRQPVIQPGRATLSRSQLLLQVVVLGKQCRLAFRCCRRWWGSRRLPHCLQNVHEAGRRGAGSLAAVVHTPRVTTK